MKKILILFLIIIMIMVGCTTEKPQPTKEPIIPSGIEIETLGNEYYVSKTGNDSNPGTKELPWLTLQKAANTVNGGDTIYVRGGTYNEAVRFYYKTNTTGQYMTLTSYPGEEVIIDGAGIAGPPNTYQYEGLVYIQKTSYVRITGLKIQNANMAGVYVGYSDHIIVDHNYTYDTVKSGVSAWGSTNIIVDSNDIALACNAHPGYYASEENISLDNVDGFEVKYNLVHKASNIPDGYSGGEGINMKNGSRNGTVHDNIVHLDERPDGKPSNRLAFGIDAWNNTVVTSNVDFYNNLAYNNGLGFIVSSEQGGGVENIKLYNNIAYNNTRAGFAIPWWGGTKDGIKKNVQFINNVSYKNGMGFWNSSPLNEGVIIRNNIFSQNISNPQIVLLSGSEGQFTIDHNLFDGNTSAPLGIDYIIGNPLFVNINTYDFHLQANSPAIDVGSSLNAPLYDYDGIVRPQGAGYEIGAFEFQENSTPVPSYTPTNTLTATIPTTNTPTLTGTATSTYTATRTATSTYTATKTATQTITLTPTQKPTYPATSTPTRTPKPTRTPRPCKWWQWWCKP